jgi:GH18 family chitinase
LADNTVSVTNEKGDSVLSTEAWTPKISSWINQFNVVFFTFINADMQVPPSFESARSSGQISASTKIIYSIGGYSYSASSTAAEWKKWFGSADSAKQLAKTVSEWKSDGIDLDIEDGVG